MLALSVLGVALGVAVVVSIDLANTSARRAFELSSETAAGRATHTVSGAAGWIDEGVYVHLRRSIGIRDIAPVVEGYVGLPRLPGRTFQLLGLDPFAEEPFRPYVGRARAIDLQAFVTLPGAVLMGRATAEEAGVSLGDTLAVRTGGRTRTLVVAALLETADGQTGDAIEGLLISDIATAQEVLDATGRLSRIDVLAPETEEGNALLERLRMALPPGNDLTRSAARTETLAQMTRAFSLNLTALSLLALMVGMFLIYNTITFSVVQRRTFIGQLRAVGVTRREVGLMIVSEAMLVGLAGTLLGFMLGYVLGIGLVGLVSQTINDLYYALEVRRVIVEPATLAKGLLLGLGATFVSALPPALEATRVTVSTVLRRSHSESRIQRRAPWLALVGAAFGAAGAALLLLPTRRITISYVALLCVLLGFALTTPAAVQLMAKALRPLAGRLFGILGRMAARGTVASLSRTAVAIAALSVSVAATIGVGVMVGSFRQTVVSWLDYTLQADLYIQPPSATFSRVSGDLDPEVVALIRSAPGVEGAYTIRRVPVATSVGRAELAAIEPGPERYGTFRFKQGDPESAWRAFTSGGGVLISEPFAYRHDLDVGDAVTLQADIGPKSLPVVGIYFDYGSDAGVIMIARAAYDRLYTDRGSSGISVHASPGVPVERVAQAVQRVSAGKQDLVVRSNRTLRETSLDVFDRTFTITSVLRLLALLVAFVGVLSALMALELERARELAVLRANGMTPGQVWRFVSLQTGIMGVMAGVLSIPLGLILAWVLTFVINRRSFGWTLQFEVPATVLLEAFVLALAAALLAGLYPAWKMSRANPSLALREE